jgi:hypothetical protein
MALVAPTAVTALPDPPSTTDPVSFDAKADALLAALPTTITQINNVGTNVFNNATEAFASATTAATQVSLAAAQVALAEAEADAAAVSAALAQSAVLASNASIWVTATTYAVGDVVFSPTNFQTYRCKQAGVSSTDPISDSTQWSLLNAGEVTLVGSQTLINKKISAFYVLERTSAVPSATGSISLDLTAATVFNLTLSGNVTATTISSAPTLSSETLSFTIRITQPGTAYSFAWFTGIVWLTVGGLAPALPAANKSVEYIFSTDSAGVYYGRKGANT